MVGPHPQAPRASPIIYGYGMSDITTTPPTETVETSGVKYPEKKIVLDQKNPGLIGGKLAPGYHLGELTTIKVRAVWGDPESEEIEKFRFKTDYGMCAAHSSLMGLQGKFAARVETVKATINGKPIEYSVAVLASIEELRKETELAKRAGATLS